MFGAGKDMLIRLTRAELDDTRNFVFPRRVVMQPTSAFEDHGSLSDVQFETVSVMDFSHFIGVSFMKLWR